MAKKFRRLNQKQQREQKQFASMKDVIIGSYVMEFANGMELK